VPTVQLFAQLQKPSPSVCALERLTTRRAEVFDFGTDVCVRDVRAECVANLLRFGEVWVESQEAREQPVAVHGRVPVVAAVERWVQSARRLHLSGVVHDVLDLVRELLADAAQRKSREARSLLAAERELAALRCGGPRLRLKRRGRQGQQR